MFNVGWCVVLYEPRDRYTGITISLLQWFPLLSSCGCLAVDPHAHQSRSGQVQCITERLQTLEWLGIGFCAT